MALKTGNITASDGMAKVIYDQMRTVIEPGLGEVNKDALKAMRESWQKLSYAIAKGVIDYIKANMEIYGIETKGDVNADVNGNTGTASPANHYHGIALKGNESNVVFKQSNDGTGHVK